VLDFGLATFLGANQRLNTRNTSIPGEFMGTIAYAAPEQVDWTFGPLDRRTDVYALGFILYNLLVARPPYPIAGGSNEVVNHILHTRPEKPSRYRDDIGHELDSLALTALLKAPQRRYPSAEEMYQAVQRVLDSPTLGQIRKQSAPWYSLSGRLTRFKPPPPPTPPGATGD
jgi:serine/threonine-protein kinase